MPAKSDKQRKAMAIAEHQPGKLYARNKGLLKMSKAKLHEFASIKGMKKPKKSMSTNPFKNHPSGHF